MAADTIKDLVVRIGLETDPSSAKKSIEDLSKTVDAASKRMVASHKKHGAEISDMAKKMAKATVGAQAWAVGIGKIDKASKAAAKSAKDMADAAQRQVESAKASSDALSQAGRSAFTSARGVALLAAAYGINTEATIRTVAAIQGGLDIFNNATLLIKSLAVATNILTASEVALSAKTTATAVATTTATVAQGGMTVSTITLTAAVRSLWVALSPVGVVVLGITAALAVGALIWRSWGSAADKALSATEKKIKSLKQAQSDAALSGALGGVASSIGSQRVSNEIGQKKLAEIEKQKADSAKRIAEAKKSIAVSEKAASADAARSKATISAGIKFRRKLPVGARGFGDDAVEEARERAATVAKEHAREQAEHLATIVQQTQRQKNLEQALNAEKDRAAQKTANSLREEKNALDDILSKRKQSLEVSIKAVATAKQAVQAEKQKVQGVKAALGDLSDFDFAELKQLAAKAKSVGLTQGEGNRFSQLGGSAVAGYTQQQNLNRLADRGGLGFLRGLSGQDNLTGAGSALAGARNDVRLAQEKQARDIKAARDAKASAEAIEAEIGEVKNETLKAQEGQRANIRKILDILQEEQNEQVEHRKALDQMNSG